VVRLKHTGKFSLQQSSESYNDYSESPERERKSCCQLGKIANVTPIYKKSWKKDPRNYMPVSLTSVPSKVMERFILSVLTRHAKDNQGIRPRQHGFMKGRSCLTNLISFYDQVTRPVDEGKAVDIVYLALTLFPTASSWRNYLAMV